MCRVFSIYHFFVSRTGPVQFLGITMSNDLTWNENTNGDERAAAADFLLLNYRSSNISLVRNEKCTLYRQIQLVYL